MTAHTGNQDAVSVRGAGEGRFDARALSVAQAVYAALRPETVILFGSRARGDYRADSDIDLMLIVDGNPKDRQREQAARDVAYATVKRIYGHRLDVDVVQYTAQQFDEERPSINRLAARVAEEGVTLNGEIMAYQRLHYDDERRREEVALRLYDAEEHCVMTELAVSNDRGDRVVGYNAQQTLEHSLKALTAALGGRYSTTHNLSELMMEVRATERAVGRVLGVDLPERLTWLSEYAGGGKYDPKPQPIQDRQGLVETVCSFQREVAERLRNAESA